MLKTVQLKDKAGNDIFPVSLVTRVDPEQVSQIADVFFPVNSILTFYDNEDHSHHLGLTWERFASGKTIVGIDSPDSSFNSIGKTGGEKSHTLTVAEMPSHTHSLTREVTDVYAPTGGSYWYRPAKDTQITNTQLSVNYTGGGQSHNNLQPYIVCSIWRRIA